ncbi:hypothetical protein Cob_v011438 [Colletotrichum orbiculare MAFF 240422]|uniref:Uncharacterized protein n=1 Tax=Colletotrichum orbiculare (strain 104-T / ATCC 96160 / CBS 514.97 / LARS 414 / MAFF 240422) TaxID=1213857 RepID=A0A484FBB0_COLOR|nr:hypothetical protein Cob_v011438 [Colletotrichum orbiculare MAFF 240422]
MPHRQLTTLQHMAAFTLLLSSQLPRTVAAEEPDAEDVPAECVPLCAPIVQLTARCEAQTTQRFGNLGRRWDGFPATHDVAERRRRRRRRKQESVRKRQGSGSESDSDSSDDEEAQPPRPALAAAKQANKVCVCEERGFDVAGVANVCAGCIARNGTAVDADEDIKEIIAECGFATPPAMASTTSTLSISLTSSAVPSTVEVPVSTAPPPMLAPINPSTFSIQMLERRIFQVEEGQFNRAMTDSTRVSWLVQLILIQSRENDPKFSIIWVFKEEPTHMHNRPLPSSPPRSLR